ncbi:MAG: S-layer family protein [Defluviitaleaceae bacterium]|nr:S-layer family protein [Defluviitaleaceae bacterium]
MKRNKANLGITLVEAVVIIAVIAVLSAVTVTSVFAFIEAGRQNNRMNIARTLYLAAQNQLTELRIMGQLEAAVERERTINPAFGTDATNVFHQLSTHPYLASWPDRDINGVPNNVHFVHKHAGSWANVPEDSLLRRLLSPVIIYQEVLDDAILIEFNIETGVVLSVFYSENLNYFSYEANPADPRSSIRHVQRGMGWDGYESRARSREFRQGFFGVSNTGDLSDEARALSLNTSVNIYDGFDDKAILGGFPPEWGLGCHNQLVVLAGVPVEFGDSTFTIEVVNSSPPMEVRDFPLYQSPGVLNNIPGVLFVERTYASVFPHNHIGYAIIWVLEHITGDTTLDTFTSIGDDLPYHTPISAKITNVTTSNVATSFARFPHFGAGSFGDTFIINSARHLYNIRYAPSHNFELWRNIKINSDDNTLPNYISNFAPITGFTGTFEGNPNNEVDPAQIPNISNLRIDMSGAASDSNAGLFAELSDGRIGNLRLISPTVIGANNGNTGGAIGVVSDGTVAYLMVKNPSINPLNPPPSDISTGGAIGTVSGGIVTNLTIEGDNISVTGTNSVGGVIGTISDGIINEGIRIAGVLATSSTVTISNAVNAGGAVGLISSGGIINGGIEITNTTVNFQSTVTNVGGAVGVISGGEINGGADNHGINIQESTININIANNNQTAVGGAVGLMSGVGVISAGTGSNAVDISASSVNINGLGDINSAGGILGHVTGGNINGDIRFSGAPSITIDGNGTAGGAIGRLSAPGMSINNITIADVIGDLDVTVWGDGNAGGAIGVFSAGTVTTLTIGGNPDITVWGNGNAGGAVGNMSGGSIGGTITIADATISGTAGAGGAIGTLSAGNVNAITVSASTSVGSTSTITTQDAGGAVGNMSGGSIGTITITDATISGTAGAGGAIGTLSAGNVNAITVSGASTLVGSTNTANTQYAGGAIGRMSGGSIIGDTITITDATISGTISAGGAIGTLSGGIVNAAIEVSGTMTVGSTDTVTTQDAGGVIGRMSGGSINADVNVADIAVSGSDSAGGAIGTLSVGIINAAINVSGTMSVGSTSTVTTQYAGGAIGRMSDGLISGVITTNIQNTITATNSVGGAIGTLASGSIFGINTLGTSSVSINGSGNAGGAIGNMKGGSITRITGITIASSNVETGGGNAGGAIGVFSSGNIPAISVMEASTVTINGSGDAGGVIGFSSGNMAFGAGITIANANVETGGGNAGGAIGVFSSGNITAVTVTGTSTVTINGNNANAGGAIGYFENGTVTSIEITGASDVNVNGGENANAGGAIGTLSATVAALTTSGGASVTIVGSGNTGGAVGLLNGQISGIFIEDPEVSGTNAGGAVGEISPGGTLTDAFIHRGIINGTISAGGVVGQNGGNVNGSVFIAVNTYTDEHVSGAGTLGGLIGIHSGGSISGSRMLAIAPISGGRPRPIAGSGSGTINDTFFLSGWGVHPFGIPYNFFNIAPEDMDRARCTAQLSHLPASVAISPDNDIFPYPLSHTVDDWPIAVPPPPIGAGIHYFERYASNTFGFYRQGGILRNDLPITEAGYIFLSESNTLPPQFRLFVRQFGYYRPSDDSNLIPDEWTIITPPAGTLPQVLLPTTDNPGGMYGFILPRDTLMSAMGSNHTSPLLIINVMYYEGDVIFEETEDMLNVARVHPYFARAAFDYDAYRDLNEFYIRTPWQMQNISLMQNNAGLTFNQNRNINFTNPNADTGAGAGAVGLANAVVTIPFSGTYRGHFYNINNLVINSGSGSAGLFSNISYPGVVDRVRLRNANITGASTTGGISGTNAGTISLSIIENSSVAGASGATAVGGIAGRNDGTVTQSAAEHSTVSGTSMVGGIVGNNASTGRVEDVYFLSNNSPFYPQHFPVIGTGGSIGGIVGHNSAVAGEATGVTRAFLFAPSPRVGNDFHPIIGGGTSAVVSDGNETTFFLTGHRHILIENLVSGSWYVGLSVNPHRGDYNLTDVRAVPRPQFGGRGFITDFMDLEWIAYIQNINMSNWRQPPSPGPLRAYPYPIFSAIATPPRSWPVADSPARPEQLDRHDWYPTRFTSERANAPIFINPHFTGEFLSLDGVPVPAAPGFGGPVPPFTWMGNDWFSLDMGAVDGWNTRPVDRTFFNPTRVGFLVPDTRAPFGEPSSPAGFTSANYIPRWRLIELQEPNAADEFMRTNHLGQNRARNAINVANNVRNSPYRYAELNAETPGTLYQVLPTTQGAQFYYSFFHATNGFPGIPSPWSGYVPPPADGDRLNFFLSPVSPDNPPIVANEPQAIIRDNAMVLIRPAQSPRSAPTFNGSTTIPTWLTNTANLGTQAGVILNPAAWNTVRYRSSHQGMPSGNTSGGPFDLSFHRGRDYLQPNGEMVRQNIPTTRVFLYDVWVGDTTTTARNGGTREGFGITFWSDRPEFGVAASGGPNTIPLNGISRDTLLNPGVGTWAWLSCARTNVIGYWGVSYGWKQFYGLVDIPSDWYDSAEFAFQSASGPTRITTGNYLDSVSFNSPAFLSIDKYIRDERGNDVLFVKPEDILTVDVRIENHGEMPANNIVIRSEMQPFNAYIEFLDSSLVITRRDGSTILPDSVIQPHLNNDYTLTITLPPHITLQTGESLQIEYSIRVLRYVYPETAAGPATTLLFFFRKQVAVDYSEGRINMSDFRPLPFLDYRRINATVPTQIFIDPVRLSKTIDGTLYDGPFDVTLMVENALNIDESLIITGLINSLIPDGFRLVGGVYEVLGNGDRELADYFTDYSEGITRITIRDAGLDDNTRRREYSYRLEYYGTGFGVSFISMSAEYRYLYDDGGTPLNVILRFPNPVVGIRPRPENRSSAYRYLYVSGTQQESLDFLGDTLANMLDDGNYGFTLNVVLVGYPDGIDNDDFAASIWAGGGGTFRLLFTPRRAGVFDLDFQILLTARRDGGTPEVFVLDSEIATVRVTASGNFAVEDVNVDLPELNNLHYRTVPFLTPYAAVSQAANLPDTLEITVDVSGAAVPSITLTKTGVEWSSETYADEAQRGFPSGEHVFEVSNWNTDLIELPVWVTEPSRIAVQNAIENAAHPTINVTIETPTFYPVTVNLPAGNDDTEREVLFGTPYASVATEADLPGTLAIEVTIENAYVMDYVTLIKHGVRWYSETYAEEARFGFPSGTHDFTVANWGLTGIAWPPWATQHDLEALQEAIENAIPPTINVTIKEPIFYPVCVSLPNNNADTEREVLFGTPYVSVATKANLPATLLIEVTIENAHVEHVMLIKHGARWYSETYAEEARFGFPSGTHDFTVANWDLTGIAWPPWATQHELEALQEAIQNAIPPTITVEILTPQITAELGLPYENDKENRYVSYGTLRADVPEAAYPASMPDVLEVTLTLTNTVADLQSVSVRISDVTWESYQDGFPPHGYPVGGQHRFNPTWTDVTIILPDDSPITQEMHDYLQQLIATAINTTEKLPHIDVTILTPEFEAEMIALPSDNYATPRYVPFGTSLDDVPEAALLPTNVTITVAVENATFDVLTITRGVEWESVTPPVFPSGGYPSGTSHAFTIAGYATAEDLERPYEISDVMWSDIIYDLLSAINRPDVGRPYIYVTILPPTFEVEYIVWPPDNNAPKRYILFGTSFDDMPVSTLLLSSREVLALPTSMIITVSVEDATFTEMEIIGILEWEFIADPTFPSSIYPPPGAITKAAFIGDVTEANLTRPVEISPEMWEDIIDDLLFAINYPDVNRPYIIIEILTPEFTAELEMPADNNAVNRNVAYGTPRANVPGATYPSPMPNVLEVMLTLTDTTSNLQFIPVRVSGVAWQSDSFPQYGYPAGGQHSFSPSFANATIIWPDNSPMIQEMRDHYLTQVIMAAINTAATPPHIYVTIQTPTITAAITLPIESSEAVRSVAYGTPRVAVPGATTVLGQLDEMPDELEVTLTLTNAGDLQTIPVRISGVTWYSYNDSYPEYGSPMGDPHRFNSAWGSDVTIIWPVNSVVSAEIQTELTQAIREAINTAAIRPHIYVTIETPTITAAISERSTFHQTTAAAGVIAVIIAAALGKFVKAKLGRRSR